MVDGAAQFSSPMSALILFYMHGAVSRIPVNATVFGARRVQWDFDAIGQWTKGSESATHIAWVRRSYAFAP
jgi:hypothetical protein